MPDGLHRLALENHLFHGRRRETVSDKAQWEGHTRRYQPRLLHSPWDEDTKRDLPWVTTGLLYSLWYPI